MGLSSATACANFKPPPDPASPTFGDISRQGCIDLSSPPAFFPAGALARRLERWHRHCTDRESGPLVSLHGPDQLEDRQIRRQHPHACRGHRTLPRAADVGFSGALREQHDVPTHCPDAALSVALQSIECAHVPRGVVSRMLWKFPSGALRACDGSLFQAARSRGMGSMG